MANEKKYPPLSLIVSILTIGVTLYIAFMQRENTNKLADVDNRISLNQIKIQESQLATSLMGPIIKGSLRERKMALLFLENAMADSTYRKVVLIIALRDSSEELRQEAISLLGEKGGDIEFEVLDNIIDNAESEKERNKAQEAKTSIAKRTVKEDIEQAEKLAEEENLNQASQIYRKAALKMVAIDSSALKDPKIYEAVKRPDNRNLKISKEDIRNMRKKLPFERR